MKTLFFLLFSALAFHATAEVPYILEREFKKVLDRKYSEKDFLAFYHVLDSLENAGVNLEEFKTYKMYATGINNLLNSTNYYQKGIAYRLLGSLKDKNHNNLLLERMKTEDNKFLKTLNAAAVMKLMPTQTTLAFDYLVNCDDFATSPLLPLYLAMDEKSIIKTAHFRLNDSRPRAKVFALQTLARFENHPKVEEHIVKALKDWDPNIKGYAVVALRVHKRGHYKEILAPYVKEAQLRDVIIETLELSNIQEDITFAEQLRKKR